MTVTRPAASLRCMPRAAYYETRNLDEHMRLVRNQVDFSMADPELRQLAVKLVSHAYKTLPSGQRVLEAWGEYFHAPDLPVPMQGDALAEIQHIWAFVVLNCRYVYDPDGYDLFASAKQSLIARGGDCDDSVIVIASLARAIGFGGVVGRVVSIDGHEWVHTYPLIAAEKDAPASWIPLDVTVPGKQLGWQTGFAAHRDYPMSTGIG